MNTTDKINPGDIVSLKSGGSRMTVEKIIREKEKRNVTYANGLQLNNEKEGRYFGYRLKKLEDDDG